MNGRRRWREACSGVGHAALPYWFTASAILLGVGGVLEGQPVVSACGAVAGVTAGLLYQHRSRFDQLQIEALRDRLRAHRTESEAVAAELRQTISSLQTELWQQRLLAVIHPPTGSLPVQMVEEPAAEDTSAEDDPAADGNPSAEDTSAVDIVPAARDSQVNRVPATG